MPIEASCPGCGSKFRVPDAAAGKKVRCPKCKEPMQVPDAPPEEPAFVPPAEQPPPSPPPTPKSTAKPKPTAPKPTPQPEMWFMKSEEGDDYGPIPRSELDAWHDEGRVTADCQVLRAGSEQWQWASDLYRDLAEEEPEAEEEPAAEPTAPTFSFASANEPATADDGADEPAPRLATKPSASSKRVAATKPTQQKSSAPQNQVRRGAKKVFSPPPEEDEETEDLDDELEVSSRSKLTAGLLGLFLGQLGIHRFYLGYVGIGLAMLFTLGGCGIWSLTDAILIFLGKVVDAEGRTLEN